MTTRPTTTRTRVLAALSAALLATVPLACSDDGEDSADAESPSSVPATEAPAPSDDPEETGSDGPTTVTVSAVDYSFEDLPDEVPAGTRFDLVNESEVELHELVAARLPDGEERSVEDLLKLPEAELMGMIGEPATVLLAPPGGDVIPAVGDGTLTEPGRYLVLCFIPTGADPAEYLAAAQAAGGGPPDVPGGPPHVAHGMFAELTVTP